jgi:MFS superfamily sulfate permease-like transporter
VAEQSGAKTQVAGLVGAAAVLVILVAVPGLLRNLPQPTLAAVVIAAALSLADLRGMRRLWAIRRTEFALAVTAFLGVAFLGVLPGIALAVLLSILNVFRRAWWPYSTTLGEVSTLSGYHDTHMHPKARKVEGLEIFRFDAPLLFANARAFREQIKELATADPPPRWIVVAAEPITDIDTTASDMLEELDEDLNRRGISLVFAELKDPVKEKILRYELTGTINPDHFYPTVESAVQAFVRPVPGSGPSLPPAEEGPVR